MAIEEIALGVVASAVKREDETYLGLLIIASFWALISGAVVAVGLQHEEQSPRAAWFWAASFVAASLVAVYCFGRLL
jgi:hypothetical protein